MAQRSRGVARALQQQLRSALELTRALSVTAEQLHERLAHNALHPSRKLRLLHLRFLAAPEPNTPPQLLASTARALLGDPHLRIRVLAATQLGAGGHDVLRALAGDSQLEQELHEQKGLHRGVSVARQEQAAYHSPHGRWLV